MMKRILKAFDFHPKSFSGAQRESLASHSNQRERLIKLSDDDVVVVGIVFFSPPPQLF